MEAPSTLGIDVRFTDRVAILARTDAHQRFTTANPQGQNYVARLNLPTAVGPIAIPDGWASVDATAGGTTFRFVTTHLSGIANPIQVAQGTELLGVLGQTTLPVVLVGDFNSSATPAGLDATPTYGNLVAGGLVDAWAATHARRPASGPRITRVWWPGSRSDKSSGALPQGASTLDRVGSWTTETASPQ